MSGGVIATHHDHRIAMSFAMAALRATDRVKVSDCAHVATSFPGFAELALKTGLHLEVVAD
jgi:5-enolpyruvylshikimate-3-phosphate synthase